MQLRVHAKGFDLTPALKAHVAEKLAHAIGRFEESVQRVQVNLEDVNGPKGGADKHCRIQIDVPRAKAGKHAPIDATESDLYAAIDVASEKAARWLVHALKRAEPSFPDRKRAATIRKPKRTR